MNNPRKEILAEGVEIWLGDSLSLLPMIAPVSHIIGDPPYEAITHAAKGAAARRIRTDGRDEIKALDFDCIDPIREQVAELCAAASEGWVILFCSPEGVGRWADVINATSAKYKRACVWVKPDSTPQLNGQGPAMGAENFVCAWAGTGFAKWNAGGKRGVYTHCCNPPTRHGGHPTEKPVSLMRELITDFTAFGDLICDPFMGSGTTGVACVKTGRRFVGIEREPKYFDMACHRISDALKSPDLFIKAPAPKAKQEFLL